jgi:predicted glycoside hydrolase/deacetylase ChbG (UPF0249 family)
MIANLPGFDDAVALAQSCPSLSLGLHLNLTTGKPLSRAPSLTRKATGEFHSLPSLIVRASLGLVRAPEVREECEAQIDRMTAAGLHPAHLNSHRHVHAHPALWGPVLEAANSRGVPNVRIPSEPLSTNSGEWRASLKKVGLLVGTRLSRRTTFRNAADHFFGISLQGGRSFAARLFALIPKLPTGTSELMTHPGYADSTLSKYDGYTWQREEELNVLCSTALRDLLARSGIDLTAFGERVPRRTLRTP